MADPFSARPYPQMRDIKPTRCWCDACEKAILYKDKAAHERGKKHRDNVAEIAKANQPDVVIDENKKPGPNKDGSGCHNCGRNHMAKDCTEPRRDNRECNNCKQTGHISKDCPQPRVDNRECRNCKEVGHIASACPHPRAIICRNCDQPGHMIKDCTAPRKPRDPATVRCNNCQQMGHFKRDCTNPAVEPEAGGFGEFGGFGDANGGGDDGEFGRMDGFAIPQQEELAPITLNPDGFDEW